MTPGVTHLPRAVDPRRALGDRRVRPADRLDPAVGQHDRAVLDPPALAVEDGGAGDRRRHARIGAGRSTDRDRGVERGPAPPSARAAASVCRAGASRRPQAAAAAPRSAISAPSDASRSALGSVSRSGIHARAPAARRARPGRRDRSSSRSVSRCISRLISGDSDQDDDADADRDPADRAVDRQRPFLASSRRHAPPVASPILPATKLPTAVM